MTNQKKETVERTVPSRDQVRKAAASCPETEAALRILFPQDFVEPTPDLDWHAIQYQFVRYIRLIAVNEDMDVLAVHPDLAKAINWTGWDAGNRPGYPGPDWVCWHCKLTDIVDVLSRIQAAYQAAQRRCCDE